MHNIDMQDPWKAIGKLRPTYIMVYGGIGGKYTCVDLTGVSPLWDWGPRFLQMGDATLKVVSSKVAKHKKTQPDNQHSRVCSKN